MNKSFALSSADRRSSGSEYCNGGYTTIMRIGIQDSSYRSFYPEADVYRKMKEHGFDCADYVRLVHTETEFFTAPENEFLRRIGEDRKRAEDAGISFWQAHGPWRYPPQDATEEARSLRLVQMQKAIRGTAALGCPHMVIHCIMPYGPTSNPEPERFYAMNAEFFTALLPCAHDYGVTLCLENLPMKQLTLSTPEQVLGFVQELNDSHLKICLDTGHAAVFGIQPADALRSLGGRIVRTLHVHDNDGRGDRHDFPYTGVVDWDAFRGALHESGFDGVVSLESRVNARFPKPSAELILRALAGIARSLAERETV